MDLTANNPEEKWQLEAMLHFGLNIHVPDESDSEPGNDFPTSFIHEVNGCFIAVGKQC